MSALLDVAGLVVERGGRRVVDVERIAIQPGEVLAVIGPNGAGKSSLLHGLALLQPARFTGYRWAGREAKLPDEALALRREMAVVFQEPLLVDGTVLENVGLGLKLRGQPASTWRPAAQAMLERLGIGHLAGRPARQLSGGEAQRVSIARALAVKPRLLYLDEPFGALDVLARSALLRELKGLLVSEGTAALFVTHDFTEIPPLADRVAVMDQGRVVQSGTPHEVFTGPATDLVRELVAVAQNLVRTLQTPG